MALTPNESERLAILRSKKHLPAISSLAEEWGVACQGKADDGSDVYRAYPPSNPFGYVARTGCAEIQPFSLWR